MIHESPRTYLAGLLLVAALSGCGGGSSAPAGPNPVPTPTPQAPPPDPRDTLPPGPIVSYSIELRSIESPQGEYRDIAQDPATGHWIVYPGDFVVFDSDQFNATGQNCKWVNDPHWFIDGMDLPEGTLHPNGVVFRKGSSNPFLLRVDIAATGEFRLGGRVDGVDSNQLIIESRRR
jgi:hypothetical protein